MRPWRNLTTEEQGILIDIRDGGADCAKFLARRHGQPHASMMNILSQLAAEGWLQRVKGTFLLKRGFRKPKHMNHTYYELTRKGKLALRRKRA